MTRLTREWVRRLYNPEGRTEYAHLCADWLAMADALEAMRLRIEDLERGACECCTDGKPILCVTCNDREVAEARAAGFAAGVKKAAGLAKYLQAPDWMVKTLAEIHDGAMADGDAGEK